MMEERIDRAKLFCLTEFNLGCGTQSAKIMADFAASECALAESEVKRLNTMLDSMDYLRLAESDYQEALALTYDGKWIACDHIGHVGKPFDTALDAYESLKAGE